ncbi:MAG: alkaline phosphatase family protein [Cytophagales bacterium]|nr:alkaline phosphatase family protein [Cytophagales bacterium]
MLRSKFLFIFLLCCASMVHAQKNKTPYVVLVSFDGFRYDYVNHFNAPNFKSFLQKGSQAEALIPSFPGKHFQIITPLSLRPTPGQHGLVDNSFYDRARNTTFGMRDIAKVVDGYYYGGVPLWQLAKQNGVKSASYFWVGSEIE